MEQLITLYGIANCDTVKKARAWLDKREIAYQFFDFKKQGVPAQPLSAWVRALSWEALVNVRGTTWRKLDEATRTALTNAPAAIALMQAHPSIIKRPVVAWTDGSVSVGFDEVAWSHRVA